ncbi:MAG: phage tail tape measure protein, partial [Pseudomonas sp.]|nr:phage tail tape measure protein [Pseudomonas sp.]
VVYAHAMTRVENVVQLGNTLLLLFERKEQSEHLLLQQQHAWDLARIAVDQQHQAMRADEASHTALLADRHLIEGRLHYFENLLAEGISAVEAQASQQYLESAQWDTKASVVGSAAGVAMLLPNIFGTSNGGMRYEGAFYAAQALMQSTANEKRANAAHLDRTALFNRRAQEWNQALVQSRQELNQVDLQLKAHIQQSAMLRLQLRHTEMAMEQARLTYEMLSKSFTSAELYQWLNSHLADFYYQAFDAAHSLCLTAQACWQFENADWATRFIQTNPWNNQFKGMAAGESLKLDLQRMNTAYMQGNRRELEISKTLSLRTLLDKEWTTLRDQMINQGTLDFELSKALYEADYPGHYLRRIKSISVSLPATLGPYQDIRATLSQTRNQIQRSQNSGDVLDDLRVNEQVALSTGLNDSGLFTLNFDTDQRYLPFEYTGAVSRWRLAFPNPAAQSAMLNSLSDIIVHVRYTARSAGGQG